MLGGVVGVLCDKRFTTGGQGFQSRSLRTIGREGGDGAVEIGLALQSGPRRGFQRVGDEDSAWRGHMRRGR